MSKNEEKIKSTIWLQESTVQMMDSSYKNDNCRSKSEFVNKAIRYYSGQLATNTNDQFISTKVASLLRIL